MQGLCVAYAIFRFAVGPNGPDLAKLPMESGTALLLLASSYILGTLIDRLSDGVFGFFEEHLRKKANLSKDPAIYRYYIYHSSPEICKVLDYIRSRIRLGRATFITSFLLAVLHLSFLFRYKPTPDAFWMNNTSTNWLLFVYPVFMGTGLYVYWESQEKWFKRLKMTSELVSFLKNENSKLNRFS